MTAVPDYVPMLIKGKGAKPEDGGCLVQIANWLADPTLWTDEPLCVDPLLAKWAIFANDMADNESRHPLALLAPRLAGTKIEDIDQEKVVEMCLREYVLSNNHRPRVTTTNKLIWKTTDTLTGVVDLSEMQAVEPGNLYSWLEAIIDKYDRLTGRTSPELLTEQQWLEIKELVGQ